MTKGDRKSLCLRIYITLEIVVVSVRESIPTLIRHRHRPRNSKYHHRNNV